MQFTAKNGLILALFFAVPFRAFAQAESNGSNYFITALIIVALLVFFFIVFQVAENLMAVGARETGADKTGKNLSIMPGLRELFAPKLPDYASGEAVNFLTKGFDILLQGEAEGQVKDATSITRYAMQPTDFIGMQPIPKLFVAVGDEVKAGDPLFYDKRMEALVYAAPVSGEVVAVNRGAKRAIVEVVILADKDQQYRSYDLPDLAKASRKELVDFLLGSGAWPMIRQRPYNVVADPSVTPRDIFISTFDSAPLAPNMNVVVKGQEAAFQKGLDVLGLLTDGGVHLGLDARNEEPAAAFSQAKGVTTHWFHGKHPAGNVGIQIHNVAPIGNHDKVWTLGVQEVISLGKLFSEGRLDTSRVVAITGAEFEHNGYVRTHIGANINELISANKVNEGSRIIDGDVLTGATKSGENFLSFYSDQITAIEEGDYFEAFGWLVPLEPRPTNAGTFPNFLYPDYKFRANSNTHGEKRAFVVTGEYEKVLPMDIYPQHLMKSILVNDFERMEGLGIYEVVEEDVAICEFVCTSKQPLQKILREGLDTMREQS